MFVSLEWRFKLRALSRVCLYLTLTASVLLSQQDAGSIVGTVTDPAGAVIPAVTVRLINTGTNITTTLQTDQNGDFTATALRIGPYRVESEAPGFKKTVQDNVELRVQDRL